MSQSTLLFPLEPQNERKTENLVRKHFEKYVSEITMEEQKSDTPRIQKLLRSASKTGTGQGYPDFIIQFNDKPEFIAVIECKPNIQRHESPNRDQYADYAVDGALLYASHLSADFDVLAIGVSGMTEQSLKVSHFLHLKGDQTAEPIFSSDLLSPQDYITGYISDNRKYQQDYDSLLLFAKDLNNRLHTNQVSESDRSLLISAILIALDRDSFKNAYKSEGDASQLSQMVVNTVKIQLQDSGIDQKRLNVLVNKFNFINYEIILQQNEEELREIIEAVDIKPKSRALKQKILSNHTLEAVLSMPDELFHNSKVGTVTCIMIFTAHRPHPTEKKVFLGYYKDDKFKKDKVHGRFDSDNKWEEVEKEWLSCYLNRTDKPGLSVNVELDHNSEWAVEKYMETDYSVLSDKEFKETLLNYSTYLFSNQLKDSVSQELSKFASSPPSLNTEEWELFKISNLFTITGTKTTAIKNLEYIGYGKYPYVTTKATNNGVRGFFDTMTEDYYGVLTIDSAVCGYCSYQSMPFSASDHVEKLIPLFDIDIYVAMFLVTIFNVEQYRYNYGLKCSQTRLKEAQIRLPVNSEGKPDFNFMKEYISHLEYSSNLESERED
jgi:hypothetical protein